MFFSIKMGGGCRVKDSYFFIFIWGPSAVRKSQGTRHDKTAMSLATMVYLVICACAIDWMDLRNIYDKVLQNFKTDSIWTGKKIKFKSD